MVAIRIVERMTAGLKRLKPILEQQRVRDISEADTVTLVKDLLAEVFGYDKYTDLTGEHAIRGTFCDLAVRIDDKIVELIEVKAIGIPLDDRHVRQAVDYAANQGVEWVILTNAIRWRLYNVIFAKPIDKNLILEIDVTALDARREDDAERLYAFTKEGFSRGAHVALRDRQVATSRFMLAALLVNNENVLSTIRRELRRVVDIAVENSEIIQILTEQVIKRDALEGPAADQAKATIEAREDRALRSKKPATTEASTGSGQSESAQESDTQGKNQGELTDQRGDPEKA
jgi:hypothetical protein